jgi:hypothetical protein
VPSPAPIIKIDLDGRSCICPLRRLRHVGRLLEIFAHAARDDYGRRDQSDRGSIHLNLLDGGDRPRS